MDSAGTYLIDHILQQQVLVIYAEVLRGHDLWFEHKDQHGVVLRTGALDPIAPRVQLRSHRLDVVPQAGEDLGLFLQHRYRLAGRRREESGKRGRIRVRSGRDALVLHHFIVRGAKASGRAERTR